MSKLTEAILTDRTGKDIAEKLHTLAVLKGIEVGSNLEKVTTLQEVRSIVQSGKAADVFQFGDQIIVPWTDTKTGTKYSVPMNIIKAANVTRMGWIRGSWPLIYSGIYNTVRRTV